MNLLNFLNQTKLHLLAGALLGAGAAACDPKVIGDESAGDVMCEEGETKPAEDGCNTCTCAGGEWACTEKACECMEGDTKPAGDGCNTCGCVEGMWACTEIGCEDPPPPECMDGDTKPAGDGCNTCGCIDGMWACTLIGCGTCGDGDLDEGETCDDGNTINGDGCDESCQIEVENAIELCTEPGSTDPKTIQGAVIEGDSLVVDVEYGGGCAKHVFTYCWDGAFLESFPVQVMTELFHESNDDACDAIIGEKLTLDLVPLKTEYQKSYQTMTGEISINLKDWQGPLLYSF